MKTEAKPMTDETPIEEIVSSERAAKHLAAHGIRTLAELRVEGIATAARIRYVGDATLRELSSALTDTDPQGGADSSPKEAAPEIEECMRPLSLICGEQHGRPIGLHLSFLPAHRRVLSDGSSVVDEPMMIEFDGGRAKFTPFMWFMRKYRRDRTRAEQAMNDEEPWRKEAAAWIRSFYSNHGKDFFIESD